MCFVFYLFALHLKVELRFVLPYMFSTLADLYVYMADVADSIAQNGHQLVEK